MTESATRGVIRVDAPDVGGNRRYAGPMAFGLLFAVMVVLMQIAIHTIASPFRADLTYKLGTVLGLGWWLLGGTILGLPLLAGTSRLSGRGASTLLAGVGFVMTSMSSHYHAVFNRLPGVESLAPFRNPETLKLSLSSHWPIWLVAAEVLVPMAVVFLLTPWLAGRLARGLAVPFRGKLLFWIWGLVPVVSLVTVLAGEGQIRYGAFPPIVNLALTSRPPDPAIGSPLEPLRKVPSAPDPAAVFMVQEDLGVMDPGPAACPVSPYCRPAREAGVAGHPRSVILVILESVSEREMVLEHQGQPLMPQLRHIASQSVHFSNFHAQGDRSAQAMVGIYSGIPAPTHRRLLMHVPLVDLVGLPTDLGEAGYQTMYMHGSDLSFEQQRSYLQKIGFAHIEEPDLSGVKDPGGWGITDGEMLSRLSGWIDRRDDTGPYFANLFTLSTHDPFVVPPGVPPVVEGKAEFARYANSLVYLDAELGKFWEWYVENEMPKGTVLMITGDHVPRLPHPGDRLRTNTGEFEYRFEVPLLVAGLTPEEMHVALTLTDRTGGHLDIAQTILGIVGLESSGCYQGRDLLDTDEPWPAHRKVVSIAGEQLEFFYVHDGSLRWMASMRTEELMLHDRVADPNLTTNLLSPHDSSDADIWEFIRAYFTLGRYLNYGNRYAPAAY